MENRIHKKRFAALWGRNFAQRNLYQRNKETKAKGGAQ